MTVIAATTCLPALAADVTRPAEAAALRADRGGADVQLSWSPVASDVLGNTETVASYRVYRDTTPGFVPDRSGGTNRVGTSPVASFTDVGAAATSATYFYLVTAVDSAGNESNAKSTKITTAPVLSGSWTDTSIDLSWIAALPSDRVAGYRVYYGRSSRGYEQVVDVGLATSYSLTGLQTYVNWYSAVTAVDLEGNESAFSNEHVDAIAGRVRVRAHNDDYLCWGASRCPPLSGQVQRNDGWQLMVPTAFPEGEWKRVLVTYTIDSRLCTPPAQGTTDKCGDTNPGGYNPCGDPWDRGAHLFLVVDETCILNGQSCLNSSNIEIMSAITPFGTDAPPPDGTGAVPPRALTLDVTPFARILTGTKYVGAEIGHYVQAGWHVTVDFEFSKRQDEASVKRPAEGVIPVLVDGGGAITTPIPITIPSAARQVVGRFFVTGHGGNLSCDGGTNNGGACSSNSQCPGGTCQNCDEFCHREHFVKVNGQTVWHFTPWRSDCSPGSLLACQNWNACGWPSCTYSRAGWCPGYIACDHDPPCDQDHDLTTSLTPGATHNFTWEIPIVNGSWWKSLVVYWYGECTSACGNNARECSEACDGTDLAGHSCQTEGFDAGTLSCNPDCGGFNTSGCRQFVCGDGICDSASTENCVTCPADCNGVQKGSPGNQYCCGNGGGNNPIPCTDARCTANGRQCQ